MQEVFKNIIEKLEKKVETAKRIMVPEIHDELDRIANETAESFIEAYKESIEIVKQVAAEYNNGWIPCDLTTPTVETEVFILAKRKYKDGRIDYITTTAIYEDGTVLENDSYWSWEDIEGEWDEENDCYIIPEGWWEYRHYNHDESYNNAIYDEVVAWQPLPEPYHPKGE